MAKKQTTTTSSSDFNMLKLDTKQGKAHLEASIKVGSNMLLVARRGTGKSVMAKEAIKAMGCEEIYLNLSVMERPDLNGYPKVFGAKDDDFVRFMLPGFYEKLVTGKKPCVLLLDEVDKADPSLWAPLLEITQFKSINNVPLPNLRCSIMTANLIAEGGARPSLPLLDRAEKYIMQADSNQWIEWAGSHGIHPSITAFINDEPNQLFGEVDPEDRYADPSPRAWEAASDIAKMGEEHGWSARLINDKIAGRVGKQASLRYEVYYTHYQELIPLLDKVMAGETVKIKEQYGKLGPGKKFVAAMIAASRTANALDALKDGAELQKPANKKVRQAVENLGEFLKIVDVEHGLIAVRSQVTFTRLMNYDLTNFPVWKELFERVNTTLKS